MIITQKVVEYQESLRKEPTSDLKITHLRGSEKVKKLMAKRKNKHVT